MTLKNVKITNTGDNAKTVLKQKTVAKVKSDIRMAKSAFVPGERVVYPCHGVGQIMTISKDEFAGQEIEFVVVNFTNDKLTLKIPLNKASAAGLRKISSNTVMKNALSTLKTKTRIRRTMWSRRAQEYNLKISSGNPVLIAEVVRELYRPDGVAEQSFSERQIYEQAMSRLAGEYAACEQINLTEASAKLSEILANT